jgi:hypothetical protein
MYTPGHGCSPSGGTLQSIFQLLGPSMAIVNMSGRASMSIGRASIWSGSASTLIGGVHWLTGLCSEIGLSRMTWGLDFMVKFKDLLRQ